MATKHETWDKFLTSVQPDAYKNGEVSIGQARFVVEAREARVEPLYSPPEKEVIILGGETINTPIYFRDLAIVLAEFRNRVHFINLPSDAKNIDDAATQVRTRIEAIFSNTDLPIKVLGQSMGGYILALLAFHYGLFGKCKAESLHFDAPALTGKIYNRADAKDFADRCKKSKEYGLLTSGNRISAAGFEEIFGCTPEEAEEITQTAQKTSGFVPALAARGLFGRKSRISYVPKQPIHVTGRTEDPVINWHMLQMRLKAIESKSKDANITIHEPEKSSRHLHLPGMTRDQILKAFFHLI